MIGPALRMVHWQRTRASRPWRAACAAKKPRRRLPVDRMVRIQTRIDQWVADVRTAPKGRVMGRRLAHCCCPLGVSTRPSGPLSTAVRFRAHRPPPAKRSRDGPTHAMQSIHTTDVTCTTTAYSATKRSFLSRTHIVAVVLHTSSHSTVQATYVDTCSPVRTLGVLPTYEHTKRTLWEAGYQLYPRLRLLNTRTVSPSERWQLVHAFGKLYGAAEPAC